MSPLGWILLRRRRASAAGRRPSRPSPIPAVSIGNLSWGGTGKTPLTIWLAGRLADRGLSVAVVLRGYRRASRGVLTVSDGRSLLAGPEEAGDEAFLIARRESRAVVVAAEDRHAGVLAAAELGARVAVLDDAFQHLRLRRSVDIVLVDASDPRAGGLPPCGRLREPPEALSAAHLVIATRARSTADASPWVARYAPGVPLLHVSFPIVAWIGADGCPVAAEEALRAPSVAVCGIGRPESFRRALAEAGAAPAAFLAFRDHARYGRGAARRVERAVRRSGARVVLTTEKDLVKIGGRLATPAVSARIAPRFLEPDAEAHIERILEQRKILV